MRRGMSTYRGPLFMNVEITPQEHRWASFMTSYIVQATAVVALVFYTVTAPTLMRSQVEHVEFVPPEQDMAPNVKPLKAATVPPAARIEPARLTIEPGKIQIPVLQFHQPQR